jgi:hypothetical protein
MKVKYIGPHDAVELPLPDGRSVVVEHGAETPELPDDFARSLLKQDTNWETREKPKQKTGGTAGKEG